MPISGQCSGGKARFVKRVCRLHLLLLTIARTRKVQPDGMRFQGMRYIAELSPNLGDGLRDQAAAVWDCEDAGLAATSIPSVNLTP